MTLKKWLTALLAVCSAFAALGFAACDKDTDTSSSENVNAKGEKYVVKTLSKEKNEQYAFAVNKDSTKKAEILAAMNKVIETVDVPKVITYYQDVADNKTPSVALEFADLTDNTGGLLHVYTDADFSPFEFRDQEDKVVGVDIYIMQLVAEELNMTVRFNDMDFDGILNKVASEDNAIGAAGITVTAEAAEKVDFSNPYYTTVQAIISTESQEYNELEDLKGKKIGVQKGSTAQTLVETAIASGVLKDTKAEVVLYYDGTAAYAALKDGDCDVMIIDELPAKKLVK